VMSYKMEFSGLDGWLMGAMLLALPFIVLTIMIKLFLSERLPSTAPLEPHPGHGQDKDSTLFEPPAAVGSIVLQPARVNGPKK